MLWFLTADPRLSDTAREVINQAAQQQEQIALSSISLIEIAYLEEKGRIPHHSLATLLNLLDEPNPWIAEIPVDRTILAALAEVDRATVPDMPDRIIAATALHLSVPLVSRDHKIRTSQVQTIW